MKKVTTISLAGRAYQVDEPAYTAVHSYLEKAKATLANDPDTAEIMADLEQSIGDKCAAALANGKTVVSESEMKNVLEALGPVETGEETTPVDTASEERPTRKLFRIKDGAMLAGVCKGFAVYFNMDVTILRLLFVLSVFITHGAMVIVYIVLAFVLPKADDTEKIAAAYGYEANAQEVAERVRQRVSSQALDGVGRGLTTLWRVLMKIASLVAIAVSVVATIGYGVGLWAIALGRTNFVGSLSQYNGWPQGLAITAAYLSIFIVFVLFARVFDRWSSGRKGTRISDATELSLLAVWVVSLVSAISLVMFVGADFRDYANRHNGYIDFEKGHICITEICWAESDTCAETTDGDRVKECYQM